MKIVYDRIVQIPIQYRCIGIFCICFGAFSLLLTYSAIMGDFRTFVFGIEHQKMWDPGGPYLSSGVFYFRLDDAANFFSGHPGLTLRLIIGVISEFYYICAKLTGCVASYPVFVVKNYYFLIFYSKLMITFVHICSFCLIQRISIRFTTGLASVIAIVSYASSYPVIYYINEVSPDPLLITFVLSAVLLVFKYMEAINDGKIKKSYCFLVGISFFTIAACFTKMMFGIPLIVAISVFLFWANKQERRIAVVDRIKCFSIYACSSLVFFLMWSTKMNWKSFFSFWLALTTGEISVVHSASIGNKLLHILHYYLIEVIYSFLSFESLSQIYSKQGLFLIAEAIFFIVAFRGVFLLLKNATTDAKRKFYLIIVISIFIAPTVIYHNIFHYYFIYMAFASIAFAYTMITWCKKYLSEDIGDLQKIIICILFICIIHFPGSIFMIDGKIYNANIYKNKYQAFYTALSLIDYNERIATDGNIDEIIEALGLIYCTGYSSMILQQTAKKFMVKAKVLKELKNFPFVIKHTNKCNICVSTINNANGQTCEE
jgi:hypothetical protein